MSGESHDQRFSSRPCSSVIGPKASQRLNHEPYLLFTVRKSRRRPESVGDLVAFDLVRSLFAS